MGRKMLAAVAAVMAAQAGAQTGGAAAPAAASAQDAGYVLGAGDVVEVAVLGREDYRVRVRVQEDGSIRLPLINAVPAGGRTPLQLSDEIARALRAGGFFANPTVSVDVATYASRYVTVLGEVRQPGLVPIDRAYRVSEILARVGGASAAGSDRITIRRATGEEQTLSIESLAVGGAAEDPLVNAGDKLYVPAAETFYIYGQVTAPGGYRLDRDMDVRKAIARGGGLTPSGSDKRVRVYRAGREVKLALDEAIAPGDVVVIGERFF